LHAGEGMLVDLHGKSDAGVAWRSSCRVIATSPQPGRR
jgi:hypothetical protein